MGPFRRYAVTMVVTFLAIQTIVGLAQGDGVAAFFEAALAFVWLGWIEVLIALPLFIAVLWALPRSLRWFDTAPRPIIGMATGASIWALGAVVLTAVGIAVSRPGPGSTPATPLSLLGSGLAIGTIGALLGLFEAQATRTGSPRHRR